jgi:hypothetical protein
LDTRSTPNNKIRKARIIIVVYVFMLMMLLFKNSIQAYVQYPEELKQNRKKVDMKIISHAWRSYKNKLVKIWRDQDTHFHKYKDLTKED